MSARIILLIIGISWAATTILVGNVIEKLLKSTGGLVLAKDVIQGYVGAALVLGIALAFLYAWILDKYQIKW